MTSKSSEDLDAYGCPICLEILFEPITMPCSHRMCKPCFAKNLELTNMHCPFCKKRIGTWCRKAKKLESLIDTSLWKTIQDKFPDELEARKSGAASTLFDEGGFSHDFAFEDGLIGKEFEQQLAQIKAEEELRKSKELVESRKLIEAIQLEENIDIEAQRQLEQQIEQQRKDEEFARQLQQSQSPPKNKIMTRSLTPKSSGKKLAKSNAAGPRQLTLEETLLNSSRKRKREND